MEAKAKVKGFRYGLTFGNISYQVICNFLLIVFTVICIYPFYYLIINSISANNLSSQGQINFLPQGVHFNNYLTIFRLQGLARAAQVSVMRTFIGTVIPVTVSAYMGYMFTKPMWGRKFWYRFVVASMYFHAGLIPFFLTIMNLGLLNNFWVYIIPGIMQPFSILLVKTFIESTPDSLQEAAEIDGAGTFKIFFLIMLPIIKPILATIAIFAAVGQWNSFMDTVLYITNQEYFTLQFVLHRYLSQAGVLARMIQQGGGVGSVDVGALATQAATMQTATSVRMTITVVITFPVLLIYPFFQKYFTQGIMIGAVKG